MECTQTVPVPLVVLQAHVVAQNCRVCTQLRALRFNTKTALNLKIQLAAIKKSQARTPQPTARCRKTTTCPTPRHHAAGIDDMSDISDDDERSLALLQQVTAEEGDWKTQATPQAQSDGTDTTKCDPVVSLQGQEEEANTITRVPSGTAKK